MATTPTFQPAQTKLILSLAEAADLLGIAPTLLYEFTRSRGRVRHRIPIPYLRLGRRRLAFRRESLEKWIAQLEAETGGGHEPEFR